MYNMTEYAKGMAIIHGYNVLMSVPIQNKN